MANRGGWREADATVVELGLALVANGITLAVHERRREAAQIFHGVHALIERAGVQKAKPAPKLSFQRTGCASPTCRLALSTVSRRPRPSFGPI